MSCGMIAMINAGVRVEKYVAYEIDKYAIKTSKHNFPQIEHMGDVFSGDFSQYEGFDFVIGGSPCTKWSICQKKDRETEASGIGWELFTQFERAIKEAKPKFFIYENNQSMSPEIRRSISETFGFEPVAINSSTLSAQKRGRLYWVGRREGEGYSRVDVEQPDDIGLTVRDILDPVGGRPLTQNEMQYMTRGTNGKYSDRWSYMIKPGQNDKSCCITANIRKGVPYNIVADPIRVGTYPNKSKNQKFDSQQYRIYSIDGKACTQCGNGGGLGAKTGLYAVPDPNAHVVRDKMIEFNGDWYPINLEDGVYNIRMLSVSECARLQTIPSWYEFPVSNTQAFKMIGNGWTCDVITHIIKSILK